MGSHLPLSVTIDIIDGRAGRAAAPRMVQRFTLFRQFFLKNNLFLKIGPAQ